VSQPRARFALVLVEAEHVVRGRGGHSVAEHAGHRGRRAHAVGRALVERAHGQAGQVLGYAGPDLARGQQVAAAGGGRTQRRGAAGRGERPVRGERAVEQGTEPADVVGDRGPAVADDLGRA
jgi:hypothetical protein